MSDIVERLRDPNIESAELCHAADEAAAEIERLRAEIERLEAVVRAIDERDPDKPTNWRYRREQLCGMASLRAARDKFDLEAQRLSSELAAERERCAKIVEEFGNTPMFKAIAAAIRKGEP